MGGFECFAGRAVVCVATLDHALVVVRFLVLGIAQMLGHFCFQHPFKEPLGQGAIDATFAEDFIVIGVTIQESINDFIG